MPNLVYIETLEGAMALIGPKEDPLLDTKIYSWY